MPGPDKKGMSVLIGFGKPGAGEDDSESDMDPKEAAGKELLAAIEEKDGKAICEAVKNIMALEGYSEDEDEAEEAEAAE